MDVKVNKFIDENLAFQKTHLAKGSWVTKNLSRINLSVHKKIAFKAPWNILKQKASGG